MKKIMKKLSLFLAVISLFSVFGTACKKGNSGSGNSSNGGNSSYEDSSSGVKDGVYDPDATPVEKREFNGVHDFTAPDTDRYLIQNGISEYKIIVPQSSSNPSLGTAKGELQNLFFEATGVFLSIEEDYDGLTHTADGKYISLGDTSLFKSSGIVLDTEALDGEGVRIVTKDNTVYIHGGYDYGLLYAVYDFLDIYFGFDCFFKDCYSLDTSVRTSGNLKLKAFDVTDIPDIRYRSNGYYRAITGDWAKRLRIAVRHSDRLFYIHNNAKDISSPSKSMHNTLNWLPVEQYKNSHAKWYSTNGDELCYTAHGDAEELDLMIEECANKVIDTLILYPKESNPSLNIMLLTLLDEPDKYCECDACVAEKERYGSMSGSLIKFINEMRRRVNEKMETLDEAYRRDDLVLGFFAYFYFEDAPSKHLEEVQLEDGVVPFLALSDTFDYQNDVYSDINAEARQNMEEWKALSSRILLWTYTTKFTDYFYPVDTFSFYNNNGYKYIASMSPEFFYNQSQITQKGALSTWHNLKAYLESKLAWNTDLDMQGLIDKYMNAMFGKAAPQMHRLFNEMSYRAKIVRQLYWNGTTILGNSTNLNNPDYYPYATIRQWMAICDEAYAAIEDLQETDPEAYTKYKNHIDAEWTSPAYITLRMYQEELGTSEFLALKARFTEVVTTLGMESVREINGEMSKFLETL